MLSENQQKASKTIPLQVILNGNGMGFVPWGQKDQNSKGMAYPPLRQDALTTAEYKGEVLFIC